LDHAIGIGLQFAFPCDEDIPACGLKSITIAGIALNIPFKFPGPKIRPSGGRACISATGMAVPETAMYEYDTPVFWQNDVRTSRKLPGVKPEAEAFSVKHRPEQKLGLGIPAFNPRHVPASPLN